MGRKGLAMTKSLDNLSYGYNSTRAAVVGIWKGNLASLKDKRAKTNEAYATTAFHWIVNLVVFGATEHFVQKGEGFKPAYSDKLANSFNDFLETEVGMDSQKQRDKYSSVISGSLGIRKTKAKDGPLPGLREVAISDGAVGVVAFLEKHEIKTLNGLMAKVQPGADPIVALATRVANLSDEARAKYAKALEVAMGKAARKTAKAANKAATAPAVSKVVKTLTNGAASH